MAARGGIDLGGTKIQAVVLDASNEVLGQARHDTPTKGGPPDVAEAMSNALAEAAGAAGVETDSLIGVGVGSPGAVDPEAGTLANPPNLPGWDGPYPLASLLSEKLGTVVRLGNDVQVATNAEMKLGAGRPYSSVLGVFWGSGVGGGIVLDRQDWIGRGAGGEIGHVVVRINGARCGCGRRGCMEAYAGRARMEAYARKRVEKGDETKLFDFMEKRGRDRLTSSVWARALEHRDPLAHRIVDRAVEALGAGIASCLNVLDPEAVIIGGGLGVRLGDEYVRRIEKAVMPHLFMDSRPPDFRLAELGDLGGAIGASLLVREPAQVQ
ncbi:MAG: ROK family protein [Thermoleophilaceae bacterium]